MKPSADPNLAQLEAVAARLGELMEELTLVGGCATGLLITDPAAAPVRPTLDVDLVVEATTLAEYARLGERVRALGFHESILKGDPLCRWRCGDLVIDLMPLEESVLGFSNRWYASAVRSRVRRLLPSGMAVYHLDAPHLLATKLDAFRARGGGDYISSKDMEDLVRVVDGRPETERELERAAAGLRAHVGAGIAACLSDRYFVEALPEYFPSRTEGAARGTLLTKRLQGLAGIDPT